MSSSRFLVTACLLGLTITTSTVYAINAFPLRSGDDLLVAPDAPGALVPAAEAAAGLQNPVPPPPPPPPPQDPPPPPPPAIDVRQTPTLLRHVMPTYPAEARREGMEGNVEVEVTIGSDGAVTHARMVRSDNPVFDQAAIAAVEGWRFSKPTEGPVVRTVELTFSLRQGAGDTPRPKVAADPDAVRVGSNIRTPTKTKHVPPVYPEAAKSAGVGGLVILEVMVGRDGRVREAQVLRSIPLLDAAAIDAVMQWEFNPTLLNGNPVPVIMTVTVNFTLDLSDPPPLQQP